MTKDDIQLLYEYDRWANNSVLQAVSTLSPEEFTRDLGGSLRSVRDTLVHIIGRSIHVEAGDEGETEHGRHHDHRQRGDLANVLEGTLAQLLLRHRFRVDAARRPIQSKRVS